MNTGFNRAPSESLCRTPLPGSSQLRHGWGMVTVLQPCPSQATGSDVRFFAGHRRLDSADSPSLGQVSLSPPSGLSVHLSGGLFRFQEAYLRKSMIGLGGVGSGPAVPSVDVVGTVGSAAGGFDNHSLTVLSENGKGSRGFVGGGDAGAVPCPVCGVDGNGDEGFFMYSGA